MGCHPHQILHYLIRCTEYVAIYLLVDIADMDAALGVGSRVGLIDVPDFAGLCVENLAVNLKSF